MSKKSLQEKLGSGLDRITAAVTKAEKSTSAEITVFIREWTLLASHWRVKHDPKEIRRRAEGLFVKHGLDKTRDRNAVMLYITLGERIAVVLGDKGIHERLEDGAWDSVVNLVVQAAKEGDLALGIVAAVGKIGAILSEHFPLKADDTNELPDAPNIG